MEGGSKSRVLGLAWASFLAVVGWLGLVRLGYSGPVACVLLTLIWFGGGWNISLPATSRSTRFQINLGGALVPLLIVTERASRLPAFALKPLGAAVVIVATLSFLMARPVAGRGVVLAWPLTGLLAGALGLLLAPSPERSALFAYIAGTLGPLLGAELPLLPALARTGASRASIGGFGAYDGLVWSGLLAALAGSPA